MYEIFLVDTSELDAHTFSLLLTLLPPSEQKIISAKRDGTNSLVAAFLVRYALKTVYGISFKKIEILRNEKGKPYLKNCPGIHIIISHSENIVVCAVSDKPVGIDVQKIKPISEAVMKRVCSDKELNEIRSSDNHVSSFIYTWTKKEAVLKKKGTGILDKNIRHCLEDETVISTKYKNFVISCTL